MKNELLFRELIVRNYKFKEGKMEQQLHSDFNCNDRNVVPEGTRPFAFGIVLSNNTVSIVFIIIMILVT